jgi:ABC-type multidrug transport system fused ATPase/permease subunit
LALIALALSPLFYFLQRTLAPRKGFAASQFFKSNGELLGFEDKSLENLRGISSFTAEESVRRTHRFKFERARGWALKMRNIDALYNALFAVCTYISGVVIVYFGIDGVRNDTVTIGALVSFIIYLGYLSVPVRGIAHTPIQMEGDASAVLRVKALLQESSMVGEKNNAENLRIKQGDIVFKDVVFNYPGMDQPVFNGVSLTFIGGETIALVGPSGSGKSTLALMLMRFYDPQQGSIFLDGIDIKSVNLSSLRKNIGVVWQEPFLYNDTVRANLRMANPEASDADLVAACKASHAWEFIQRLPLGLETMVGTEGVTLSAGQCQRISIAQAFLKDAPILVLDEAASALDSESEQAINLALNRLRAGRTTLIIAHRYSSLRSAHKVVYLNGDGTVCTGLHKELMRIHPGYKNAVEWQTGSLT